MWADLQRQAIQSALSLAESILTDNAEAPSRQLREKLFDAISVRAKERKQQILEKQNVVITYGDRMFDEVIVPEIQGMASVLTTVMRESDPHFSAQVEMSDEDTKHWFKIQIVELADKYGYFCDLQSYHRWIRLKMLSQAS